MTARLLAAAAVLMVLAGGALAADPEGHYVVRGTNPGSGRPYEGVAVVVKTGDTYRVECIIGDQTHTGTGIVTDDALAVSYYSGHGGGQVGVALYSRRKDGSWHGLWTVGGGRLTGTDVWTPR